MAPLTEKALENPAPPGRTGKKTAKKAGKTAREEKKQSPPFAFRFFMTPAQGSTAKEIVRRWEEGEISRQEANNLLMLEFASQKDAEAYSALYQLNERHFLNIITRRLNGFTRRISPADVLQDVFILIYRYPDKFRADHERSFYNWSYSIIVNTIRRKIRRLGAGTVNLDSLAGALPDRAGERPVSRAIAAEEIERLKRVYALTLVLYLNVYRSRLTQREKDVLHLVEVDRLSYLDAAETLGLNYDNLKMVVSRARRKIVNGVASLAARAAAFSRARTATASLN